MVLKNVFAAIVGAMLLGCSGLSVADESRPDEFLGLDLSGAVLSPKPLGPATQFVPVRIEARADRVTHAQTRVARLRADKSRGAVRTRLARRGGNPLDAQAFDTRIQAWPCKSGGICNWK